MTVDYKQVAAEKAQSLIDKIPKEWVLSKIPSAEEEPNVNHFVDNIVSLEEQKITNMGIKELLENQENGKLTAVEITKAFCHRAALIHQLTECLTEIFFDLALERAEKLDKYFETHKKLSGPLHGIPISLKDQINIPGIKTAIGYVAPHISEEFESIICHKKPDDLSLIAEVLQNHGAIFYVKTTVPMAMLGGETSSNLSSTVNSLDRTRACGGSSGGEGALIAAKGSVLGLGTDIGGSIRIPSYVHGLFGLRPTSNRFPYLDISNSYPNQIGVCSVVGPMCRTIDDLSYVSKIILNDPLCDKDPKHIPLPWNEEKANSDEIIKIGVLKWDNEILPHPPITNTLDDIQTLLATNDKFQVKSIDPTQLPVSLSKLGNLLLSLYSCDNYEEMERFCQLSGEPYSELFQRSFTRPGKMDNVAEFFEKVGLKQQYQVQFDKIFQLYDIDCILMPAYSCVTWFNGENGKIGNFYTRAINVLDYPAMTFPAGKVSARDVEHERTSFNNAMDESNWKYYKQKDQLGKTVSVQLLCKRYQEEKCCNTVKRITDLL